MEILAPPSQLECPTEQATMATPNMEEVTVGASVIQRQLHALQGSKLPWASSLGAIKVLRKPISKLHPQAKVVAPQDEETAGTGLGLLP